jgi:hypothetical protein
MQKLGRRPLTVCLHCNALQLVEYMTSGVDLTPSVASLVGDGRQGPQPKMCVELGQTALVAAGCIA